MKKKEKREGEHFFSPVCKVLLAFILITGVGTISGKADGNHAQNTRLTFSVKNATVKSVLNRIEKSTGFSFMYESNVIDVNSKVDFEAKDESIESILVRLLGSEVSYRIVGKHILLFRGEKQPSQKVSDVVGVQQQRTVTGKVTDQSGQPLPGATIVIKGTSQGTVTDADGNYSLSDVPDNATLVFSFVGMETQEINVGNRTRIDVTMQEEAVALEEVVAVGYGVQRKINLTGAITSVKTEELVNIPVSNLSNALAGRAPGVQVIGNSGLAGASATIRMRGSFNDPLYVIDGIIKDKATFDALDVNEVESINFLKDAASASIYGSSAGNGVVIVTTKKGEIQKPIFEYKGSFSTSRTTNPIQNYTATEELEYVNNMMVSKGQPKPYGQEIFDYFKDKSYNINDLIWRNPSVQWHNLSVNGGSERILYYLAVGYYDEKGSYHNTDYKRYNFRSNITGNISDHFKVNVNLSGNQRNYDRWYWPYDGADDFTVSDWFRATFNWTRLYPFYVDVQGNPTNNPNDYPVKTPGGYHPPEIMLHGGYRDTKYRNFDGVLRFDLDLGEYVEGLSTSFQGQLSAFDKNMKSFVLHNRWYIFQPGSATNPFIPGPIDFTQIGIHNLSAPYENIQENVNLSNSYQINWFLNYERQFNKHGVSALAVYEQAGSNGKSINGRAEQLLSSSIDQIYNTSSDTQRRWFDGNENEYARASWIGRINYNYAQKYIAEFSFRYDGNYKFAPEKRWGFFPSFSAGWRISEESFLKNLYWLSNLKLRSSYGTTGSDSGIDAWRWTNVYNKTTGYVFGSSLQDGLAPGAMPNPDITWSTVSLWDVGLEFGIIDNKIRGELDLWSKTESDILGTRIGSTPTTLGASLPSVNYAQRSWDGFEISASWNSSKGNLNYEIYANMGYAIDQWDILDEPESYHDGTYKDNWRSSIGKPANRIGGYISKGIIRTQEELDALPEDFTQFGRKPMLGYLLFEDIRGDNYSEGPDGKIDSNDWTYLSNNGAPRINYGFGFNLDIKGFVLNAHFQGVGSYDRMIETRNGGGVFQVDRPYFEIWARNYWTPENPNAKYPRVTGEWMETDIGGGPSTFWLRNGSFLRLKNLNIAYTLPQQWYQHIGVTKIQLFVNGTNLFYISGLKEHDPEQATLDSYPLMKTFTGGLTINF